ncbi:hypothetical protein GCM10011378_07760 [Hymenobacter glacieicola]|uniref:Uncharacterized protein n=1 Tax=Hymenobacter glacieicola TaxID=1562124 RepID=A0ABQ1WK82_9BACT|nr:hypothetical protein GCM10011378_07760 [Hymenobacter glacieicola]
MCAVSGKINYSSGIPGKPGNYHTYTPAKTYGHRSDSSSGAASGTYTYTIKCIVKADQRGTGTERILILTSSCLTPGNGKKP